MKTFTTIRPTGSNYTPAGLINEYAKAVKATYSYGKYLKRYLTLATADGWKDFDYHHWKITDNGNGTETITVYLQEV